jgi:hypothetical protein
MSDPRPVNQRSRRAATVAALVWLASQGCARPSPAEADRAGTASTTPSAAAAVPAVRRETRTRGWDFGRWYAYRLTIGTTVSFGDDANRFDFTLDGVVEITPTTITSGDVTLYVAVAQPKIVSRIPSTQAKLDQVAKQIESTGCFFTLSGGRVTEMFAPRALSTTAATAYREIGSALQFAHSAEPARRYTVQEFDTTGQYDADYEFDDAEHLWHKTKTRYVAILAAKRTPTNVPARVVPHVDVSEGAIRLGADGRPETIDLKNTVTVNGGQQPVHSRTTVLLQDADSKPARQPGPDWAALVGAMQRTGADEPYGGEPSIEALDDARIQGMTFEAAVAQLERLAKEKTGPNVSSINGSELEASEKARQEGRTADESRLFIALAAILREQPLAVSKAVRRIKAHSPAADVLIAALGSASSTTAQNALAELSTSKALDPMKRNRVVLALSRTPRPDPKSIDLLESMLKADPFSEQALLGLGSYARRLRDAGSLAQAASIGDILIDTLKSAKATIDILNSLRAITNSGYVPALPYVSAYLDKGDDGIRAAAVRSLQSMQDESVDGIIAQRIQSDSSSEVRISALGAAKVREPSDLLTRAVQHAAASADDAHVRYRAVDLLASWIPRRPDVRGTLERVAASDSEPRVRDRAQRAL